MGTKHPLWPGTWCISMNQYEGYTKLQQKHHAEIGITSRCLFGWWYFLVPILCWSKSCAEPTTCATLLEYLTLLGWGKIKQLTTSVNKSASKCIKKNAMPSRFSFEDAGLIPSIEIPGPNIKNDNRFESELFLCQESIPPAWFLNAQFSPKLHTRNKNHWFDWIACRFLPFCFHTYWFVCA